jgi:hypothetical protein
MILPRNGGLAASPHLADILKMRGKTVADIGGMSRAVSVERLALLVE